VAAFKRGESPEAIQHAFDTVSLADVYSVLAYYLRHTANVEEYLLERQRIAAVVRGRIEAAIPPEETRTKLLARHT
jgi:uncharacterized protein (DUF433 family)